MEKIVSLFQRNFDGDRLVRDEVVPDAEWVLAGEGVATRKLDGTCCLIRDSRLFKRYEIKKGKSAPPNFEPASDVDPNTGKQQGWVPVTGSPDDQWHREAISATFQNAGILPSGTYELIGPKIQGNPERAETHLLLPHGQDLIPDFPRNFEDIRKELLVANEQGGGIEGVVWHHPDGRMAKIKLKDFGIKRKLPENLP